MSKPKATKKKPIYKLLIETTNLAKKRKKTKTRKI
jgi:hypothetical protein